MHHAIEGSLWGTLGAAVVALAHRMNFDINLFGKNQNGDTKLTRKTHSEICKEKMEMVDKQFALGTQQFKDLREDIQGMRKEIIDAILRLK